MAAARATTVRISNLVISLRLGFRMIQAKSSTSFNVFFNTDVLPPFAYFAGEVHRGTNTQHLDTLARFHFPCCLQLPIVAYHCFIPRTRNLARIQPSTRWPPKGEK